MRFLFALSAIASLTASVLANPLATLHPCPHAPASIAPPPITVTSQYQAVSTCLPQKSCIKKHCVTNYSYKTYSYVSTVIPCPFASESVVTVTRTDQTVLVSKTKEIVTVVTTIPTKTIINNRPTTKLLTTTALATISKEWTAVYKDLAPLALPGFKGSGLCVGCLNKDKSQVQVLQLLECVSGTHRRTKCVSRPETWIYRPASIATTKAVGVCATHAVAPSAGTYVYSFPQKYGHFTTTLSAQRLAYTFWEHGHQRTTTTTAPATRTTVPGGEWTAFVTKTCAHPTVFDFTTTVTKTVTLTLSQAPWHPTTER